MFKNMKTATKNITGFGLVIFVILLTGVISAVRMTDASRNAAIMADEYVPETVISADLERNVSRMMYEMRDYALSNNALSLEEGLAYLEKVKENIEAADALAAKSDRLVVLRENIEEAKNKAAEYESLIKTTQKLQQALENNHVTMDTTAKNYIGSCKTYLGTQSEYLIGGLYALFPPERQEVFFTITILINDVIDLGNDIRILGQKAQARRKPEMIMEAVDRFERVDEKFQTLLDITEVEGAVEHINATMDAAGKYKKALSNLYANWKEMENISKKREKAGMDLLGLAHLIANKGLENATDLARDSRDSLSLTTMLVGGGILICIVLGVAIALFITRSVTRPLGAEPYELSGIAMKIAEGDLNLRFKEGKADGVYGNMKVMAENLRKKARLAESIADGDLTNNVSLSSDRDILGKALEKMTLSLRQILGSVSEAAEQVAMGSNQISDSSQSLSQGAAEQAAALEEVTSSMVEIGSQTKSNAENASQANLLSGQARDVAEQGKTEMENMISAMSDINDSSQAIAKIIKVIDEIAFQTNLLALNAAVEAARAGRHGKGFAVVAEEVRNLAGRSAKAAKETAALIEGAGEKVTNGNQIAGQTAEALNRIVDSAIKVADLVGEIAASSSEQANGIAQVNQGLGQVDQVTQQNTANAEETASSSEELSGMANQLKQILTQFSLPNMGRAVKKDNYDFQTDIDDIADDFGENGNPNQGEFKANPEEIISLSDGEFGKY